MVVAKKAGSMASIEFRDEEVLIDASVIAKGLKLEPDAIQMLMQQGRLTSLCERGTGEDEGRYRLTFFSENRRFSLVVDAAGGIIFRHSVDYGDLPMPRSARRPGR
jgi:hypothetical protein